jgi:hypothetical protein
VSDDPLDLDTGLRARITSETREAPRASLESEYLGANGYPISLHSLNRLCAPRCAQGPPIAGVWGGKAFYAPDQALEWARVRFGANE